MVETWATSVGLDLHLELPATRPRAGLEAALRDAVRGGTIAAGTALPSSRALARDLGIARNTVAEAYAQLVAEGWLAARHGSGTWVAERAGPLAAASTAASRPEAGGPRCDLRPGVPDVAAFPRAAWLTAARKALAAASASELTYADPRGLEVLRTALAEYVGRARGVSITPDRIVVCSGFTQGLELLCEVLVGAGARTLAVEAYSHSRHRQIAARAGMRLTALPVDGHGAVVAALAGPAGAAQARRSAAAQARLSAAAQPRRSGVAAAERSGVASAASSGAAGARRSRAAAAVLLTPAHQFPLGVLLAPDRRRQVADWAARTGGVVIEDDYDGEFRYDRQAVGALQPLAPDHVVYAGTASKSLAPGLRLGWLALPERLAADVVAAKLQTGRLSSSLDQLTLAELIRSGGYDRQVRRARLAYRLRLERLVGALARQVPEVRVTGIAAGLHALLRLPPGLAEEDVIARAATRGLAVQGLAGNRAGEQDLGPALVVGYATPPAHAFSTAVARLCAVLREAVRA